MPNILIVDDEVDLTRVITEYIDQPGRNIWSCNSVDQGIKTLLTTAIDIIICDFNMPTKSGAELWRHVSNKGNTPIFIFFSGTFEEKIKSQLGAGKYIYCAKPNLTQLEMLINVNTP